MVDTSFQRIAVPTADGSTTLYLPQWNEHYHSVHGAVQESNHVFIQAGLLYYLEQNISNKPIQILEVGMGTGLNALLTAVIAQDKQSAIDYTALEAYPLSDDELRQLNFSSTVGVNGDALFEKMHSNAWGRKEYVHAYMQLCKEQVKVQNWHPAQCYDLIYFDAFAPAVQPELWTEAIFQKLFEASCSGSVLVTYCVKGEVRRAMKAVGWEVCKIPGPPGKREMTRAIHP